MSRRMVLVWCVLGLLLVPELARAEGHSVLVNQRTGKCVTELAGSSSAKDSVDVVIVDDREQAVDAAVDYEIVVDGHTTTLAKGERRRTLALGGATDVTIRGGEATCQVVLTATPDDNGDQAPSAHNAEALHTLAAVGIRDNRVAGDAFGHSITLYHLPDGSLPFGIPAHVSEEDEILLQVVLPEPSWTVEVEVITCDDVPHGRVDGSAKAATAPAGTPQAGERTTQQPGAVLRSVGSPLHCSGVLSYRLDITRPSGQKTSKTQKISIDPIYRFSWGLGFMFDFGRPRALGLADRPDTTGMGTEKFVSDTNDRRGLAPVITLTYDFCGTNPADMDWCDRLFNPTILLDPTRLDEGFGIGLTLRPSYEVALFAGVTLFQSEVLTDGTRVMPNDTWTTSGDLPTHKVFNRDSFGFVVALTVPTDVFAALAE
jgi:hypothetical protein